MDVLNKLLSQLLKFWGQASVTGRVVTIASAALMLFTIAGAAIWSSRPDYKPLRDGISPIMTAEIVSILKTSGIPNRMNYSGSGVLVPSSRWNEANIAISALGIADDPTGVPTTNGGLFPGKPSHTDYLRQKEVALERSLSSLRAVKSADVHLAIPEPSPFARDRQPSTASVIIEPQAGQIISKEKGMSIVHMVASAVEGLDPKNVNLVGADGSIVGNPTSSDPATIRHDYVRDLESGLAMKAQDVLAAVLGPHQSVVRVTAVVDDFLDKVVTVNKIESDAKVRLSETITSSDSQGAPLNAGGAAGTSSNGGAAATSVAGGSQISGKQESNETTYDYPRSTEQTREVGGQTLRLSISATVDVTVDAGSDAGGATPTPLTQQQVEGIIKSAVGFDTARGDQIEVVLTEFSGPPTDVFTTAVPDTQKWEFISQLARNSSLGLAAVVALLIGVMTIKKLQPIEVSSSDNKRQRELMSELSSRVDENPEAVSRILAAWLSEDKESSGSGDTNPMKKAA